MARYANKILDIVCTSGKHMTAEQIFLLLKEECPGVVIATVYNNLNSLVEKGKIRKISVEGFPDRYDNSVRHDHLVCLNCGKLTDIQLPDMKESLEKAAKREISAYDLKLFYICDECRAARDVTKGN